MANRPIHVYLDTLGCRLNEAELQMWRRDVRSAGHRVVEQAGDADLLVVNTCAVTAEAARKSRQFVRRLHRANPTAKIAVTGCFAELEPAQTAALPGVDLVVGNRDKRDLVSRSLAELDVRVMPELATEPAAPVVRAARTRAFIKVQDGCRHRCTYCIVTVARGAEVSRSVADIVDEVRSLVDDGVREVVLTGVHLGGYGHDLGSDLAALTRAVLSDTDADRVRLSSLEPWDLADDFFSLWHDTRLMPHLHLPLQSGSDTVLRRMGRRCDTAHFARLVERARAQIPGVTITTDIIVGFPGESEDEWRDTVDFVERIGFGHIHIFAFSPREGTGAARHPNPVSTDVKRRRSAELHELAARMKRAHLARHAGDVRSVLWETRSGDRWAGYTDNYLRVSTDDAGELANTITPSRLRLDGDRLVAFPVSDTVSDPVSSTVTSS